jgi:hypothetical protein
MDLPGPIGPDPKIDRIRGDRPRPFLQADYQPSIASPALKHSVKAALEQMKKILAPKTLWSRLSRVTVLVSPIACIPARADFSYFIGGPETVLLRRGVVEFLRDRSATIELGGSHQTSEKRDSAR